MSSNISQAAKIIERVKSFLAIEKDGDLSNLLEISQSTLSTWKARDQVDFYKIFAVCEGANFHWVVTGAGPQNAPVDDTGFEYVDMDMTALLVERLEGFIEEIKQKKSTTDLYPSTKRKQSNEPPE